MVQLLMATLPGLRCWDYFLLIFCKLKYRKPQMSLVLEGSALLFDGGWIQARPGFSFVLGSLPQSKGDGKNDQFICTFFQ